MSTGEIVVINQSTSNVKGIFLASLTSMTKELITDCDLDYKENIGLRFFDPKSKWRKAF